jgi:hypothetical protein
MLDSFSRQLHKLVAQADDALVAAWLQKLCDGEGSSAVPRRPAPPDLLPQPTATTPIATAATTTAAATTPTAVATTTTRECAVLKEE